MFIRETCRPLFGASLIVLFLILPVAGGAAARQTNNHPVIAGTVHGPDGAAVAHATVTVRTSTGVATTVETDARGMFSVDGLAPGRYIVSVLAPGFAPFRRDTVRVTATDGDVVDVSLLLAQVNSTVDVSDTLPVAARQALSQSSLDARSARSEIGTAFIDNFTSPVSDFSQIVQMAPGTFSVSPNGVGLGDTKTFFRGFKDGQYSMTFDGIPFNDTNDPTHHSWAFFPSQFIGSTVFERSPGSAASIGPSTYGGSINLRSRSFADRTEFRGTGSYGSYSTNLMDAAFDTGRLGPGGRSRLLLDVHQMKSDGYQTYNSQDRKAFSAKYQFELNNHVTLTAFSGIVDLRSNTPNAKGPTRAQVGQFGDNYLLSGQASDANFYGYNFYHIPTDFEYAGAAVTFGHGWSLDNKTYTYRYYNKQNYNGTTITATSATDKLNSYRKYGNLAPLTQISRYGVFRTGLWSEYAMTDRYQTPSDPRTWANAALPNFHETFNTTTLQPYAEYQWRVTERLSVTPGAKWAYFKQDFTQFADNGKTVGNLNGAASISHAVTYTTWLPSFDAHYVLGRNWSAYGQYGRGTNIPPTSVFDVKNGAVATLPKPTETSTYQVGTVLKTERMTFDVDAYRIAFQNDYSSSPDPQTGEPVYFATGSSVTRGVEAESTVMLGGGFAVYLNGTIGSATYASSGLWVQNAPRDTETISLSYRRGGWDVAMLNKRVGRLFNDNGDVHEAVTIDPFNITNLFVNYTLHGGSAFSSSKIRLSVNNVFDDHSITGVSPALKTSVASPGDILTLLPARSVSLTFTVGLSRKP